MASRSRSVPDPSATNAGSDEPVFNTPYNSTTPTSRTSPRVQRLTSPRTAALEDSWSFQLVAPPSASVRTPTPARRVPPGSMARNTPTSTTPIPSGSRSLPHSASPLQTLHIPHIVRGGGGAGTNGATAPSTSGRPSNRGRRASSSAAPAPSTPRKPSTSHLPQPTPTFTRPSYLEYSALRRFITTESPPASQQSSSINSPSRASNHLSNLLRRPRSSTDSDSESEGVPSPKARSAYLPQARRLFVSDTLVIPTRWNDRDRCPPLVISHDGRDVTFNGEKMQGDRDAAAVRTDHPIPPGCGMYYYEVEILNKGIRGHIGIGFGTRDVALNRLPGWEIESWGYHGDDGKAFSNAGDGQPYGPRFGTEDIIGCGIDFVTGRAFYTKNGAFLDSVFDNFPQEIYPLVGLRSAQESIRTNFGQHRFAFDIESHIQQARNKTWSKIQRTPVGWYEDGVGESARILVETNKNGRSATAAVDGAANGRRTDLDTPLNALVLDYLTHHGYARTVQALKSREDEPTIVIPSSKSSSSAMLVDGMDEEPDQEGGLPDRRRIIDAVVSGDIDSAMRDSESSYPAAMDAEQGLMRFKLRCRKFIEMILDAATALKKVTEAPPTPIPTATMTASDSMDVDDELAVQELTTPSPIQNGLSGGPSSLKQKQKGPLSTDTSDSAKAHAQSVLDAALAYGQSLHADYVSDPRVDVQHLFKRTFSLVAFDNPLEAGGEVTELAGQKAREDLADELNKAILKSLGRPIESSLERVYRQAGATVIQLGLLGEGAAAFADVEREFC